MEGRREGAPKSGEWQSYALLTAGKKALENGGLTEEVMNSLDKARCGVLIRSAMGGMKVFNDAVEALRISYKKMNPLCEPTNMDSAMLAMDLVWMGPNYAICTGCATSSFYILNAANHIIRDEADVMFCGGSDSALTPIGLRVLWHAGHFHSDPMKASPPWDVDHDGFVVGWGGVGGELLETKVGKGRIEKVLLVRFLGRWRTGSGGGGGNSGEGDGDLAIFGKGAEDGGWRSGWEKLFFSIGWWGGGSGGGSGSGLGRRRNGGGVAVWAWRRDGSGGDGCDRAAVTDEEGLAVGDGRGGKFEAEAAGGSGAVWRGGGGGAGRWWCVGPAPIGDGTKGSSP